MSLPEMPAPTLVADAAGLSEMVSHLSGQSAFAIDTESDSLYAYHEKVCLMQISSEERDFLVDPFRFESLEALGPVFADEGILKVFHAGDYDLACLKRDYHFTFVNLFDTMLAATALAEPNLGLAGLLEKYLGITLDKKYQRANWGERPLKPEMLAYAQADSHYLLQLRMALTPLLVAKGRLDIVQEDSNALACNSQPLKNHTENVWRIKGVKDLAPEALSLLQALNHLREELAEQQDRPPFKVFSDRALIEIAQTKPNFPQELDLLPSLSAGQVRRYGKQLMHAVNTWRKKPAVVKRSRVERHSDAEMKRRDLLSEWRKEVGLKEGVQSNVILPREMLEYIASKPITHLEELRMLMAASPRRFERYGQQIFEVLQRRKP